MRILLDMDEVLSDFVGGVCRCWGADPETVLLNWTPGQWDMVPPLGATISRPLLTPEEFWGGIEAVGEEFWTELEPLPWIDTVLTAVSKRTNDWWIVTSPSECPTSYSGKLRWLRKYLGPTFRRYLPVPSEAKCLLARIDTILIDDRDSTVAAFRGAGGKGIVFPRHHNSKHALKADPVAWINEQLGAV